MATITTLAGGTLPATTGASPTAYARDSVLIETATTYEWLSAAQHRVTLTGNFTYPGGPGSDPAGSVTSATFDLGNDGTPDLIVDVTSGLTIRTTPYLASSSSSIFESGDALLRFLLAGADTMTLMGQPENLGHFSGFAADGPEASLSARTGADMIEIRGQGVFLGDLYTSHLALQFYGDDVVNIEESTGSITVVGDTRHFQETGGQPFVGRFGDDRIEDNSAASAHSHMFVGDLLEHLAAAQNATLYLGDDTIFAFAGDDPVTIMGDIGDSFESSGTSIYEFGDDILYGSTADDEIYGDARAFAGSTNDTPTGADTLYGRDGSDLVVGDFQTADAFTSITANRDVIFGADGNDTLIGDIQTVAETAQITFGVDYASGGLGDDLIFGDYMEAAPGFVTGVFGNDALDGGAGSDTLWGQIGNDRLTGAGGDDFLYGGEGNDSLSGGAGIDILDGGPGIDTVFLRSTISEDVMHISLTAGRGFGGNAEGDILIDIESAIGSSGADSIVGTSGENTINRSGGADTIRGMGGDDVLGGTAGGGLFYGGAGDDTVTSRFSSQVYGQGGDDYVVIDSGAATLSGGAGNDFLQAASANDLITGGGNNDTLDGGRGNDIIRGGAGLDSLIGGDGNDVLNGGVGGDLHDGGRGNDTMNGGTNDGVRDTFVFGVGYDTDRINAFDQVGTDRIELDDALWLDSHPGGLTEQEVVDTFGSLNVSGTILTLDFGDGDILEVQNGDGIDQSTLGTDILVF